MSSGCKTNSRYAWSGCVSDGQQVCLSVSRHEGYGKGYAAHSCHYQLHLRILHHSQRQRTIVARIMQQTLDGISFLKEKMK